MGCPALPSVQSVTVQAALAALAMPPSNESAIRIETILCPMFYSFFFSPFRRPSAKPFVIHPLPKLLEIGAESLITFIACVETGIPLERTEPGSTEAAGVVIVIIVCPRSIGDDATQET